MKNCLLILSCLALYASPIYPMQKELSLSLKEKNKQRPSKQDIFDILIPNLTTFIPCTNIDLSNGKFTEKLLPLDLLLNALPNLRTANFSYNNIKIVSVEELSYHSNQLTKLNLSYNKIKSLDLETLLFRCKHLTEIELQNNKTLQSINVDTHIIYTTRVLPSIDLRNSALDKISKNILINKYIENLDHTFYESNVCISTLNGCFGCLAFECMILPLLLSGNHIAHIIPCAVSVATCYAINNKLYTNMRKRIKNEKLYFDD